jgi:hypothetical protein
VKSSAPSSVKFGTLLKRASPPGVAVLDPLRCLPLTDQLSGHSNRNVAQRTTSCRGNKDSRNNIPECTSRLQGDVDSNSNSRMLRVVHVISVVDVVDIYVVSPIPNGRPGFRAWIDHAEPEAAELETRGAIDHHDWDVVDAKPVSTAKMRTEAIFRNTVSVVATAFVPAVMLMLPVSRPLALPDVLP